jgi:hypothetical protein
MRKSVLFSSLLLLAACGKNDSSAPAVTFEGYTGRDAKNVITSPTDATDWTIDTNWNSTETGLFAKYKLTFTQPLVAASTWQVSLYPNPATLGSNYMLQVLKDKTNTAIPPAVRMAYFVVDTNYNVLDWGDNHTINQQSGARLLCDKAKFSPNTLYRLYYVVYDEITLQAYYKGHGDVQIAP